MTDNDRSGDELHRGPADETVVSLSQVLLAPLNPIFKAQVHTARSFLNFALELSYPHREEDSSLAAATTPGKPADTIYSVEFVQEVPDVVVGPNRVATEPGFHHVTVPALALVPLRPLAVQEAALDLAMNITWIGPQSQTHQDQHMKLNVEETEGQGSAFAAILGRKDFHRRKPRIDLDPIDSPAVSLETKTGRA